MGRDATNGTISMGVDRILPVTTGAENTIDKRALLGTYATSGPRSVGVLKGASGSTTGSRSVGLYRMQNASGNSFSRSWR